MNELLERAGRQLLACCNQQRYRTAWLIGPPMSGKTTLARQLCDTHNWRYRNYTFEPGMFDALQDRLETYQPLDLVEDIRQWGAQHSQSVTVIDEIDAVLAIWSPEQRRFFANRVSRQAELAHGLILVSNFFDPDTLAPLLPDRDFPAYFHLSGVSL